MQVTKSTPTTTTFARLRQSDAAALAAMEDVYPEPMRQGLDLIQQRLGELQLNARPMSWIARRENRCLSYLIAYPSVSQLDTGSPEPVIYIDDLQVTPGYSSHLFCLLKLLAKDLHQLGLAGLPIEGICRRNSYRVFRDHAELIRKLGWELESKCAYWDEITGESMYWLRWTPFRSQSAPKH
jgi:hypothetical protein